MSTPHAADAQPLDLGAVGDELLEQARSQSNGHASRLVVGGSVQRAVLMALTSGAQLSDHESPPAATFQVVRGSARLRASDGSDLVVGQGQVVSIPPHRHGVDALEDSIILLTVALG